MVKTAYRLDNEDTILSPALIYYPEIIERNTKKVIDDVGGAQRLWPHIKTHKMAEMIKMQVSMGIKRFKCATVSEAETACGNGAEYVLLAYPVLGPAIERFIGCAVAHRDVTCIFLADSRYTLEKYSEACVKAGIRMKWMADVNMGMDRTGIVPEKLKEFVTEAVKIPNLEFSGFHCYDGNNHMSDKSERISNVRSQFARVKTAEAELEKSGISVPDIIAGGSPTYKIFAQTDDKVFVSPGTVFVWDRGYEKNYPEMNFTPAGVIMTRVVSHPADGVFTVDCGYKAIAADPGVDRGVIDGLPEAEIMFQSEEHWTWKMKAGCEDIRPEIGEVLYIIPTHICPTTALHRCAHTAYRTTSGAFRAEGSWPVSARNRE